MSAQPPARFPKVSGSNLEGRRFNLPADFGAELNIVFVPFQQWHQSLVDGWAPFAKALAAKLPGVAVYELPTLERFNPVSRFLLNNGMRMGIPDRTVRETTITLYLDKAEFRQALAIPDESTMHTFLLRRSGEVLWRTSGPFSEAQGRALSDALFATVVL